VVALVLVAAAAAGAFKMHEHDQIAYNALADEFSRFKGGLEALGLAAEKRAKEQADRDKADKENTDAENKAARARDADTIARLRSDAAARDSRGGSVSPAPGGSKCPDGQTCFDRAEYQRALGEFDSEARRGADEGTSVTTDLDSAKTWAQKKKK
jgi:hypothetical protein